MLLTKRLSIRLLILSAAFSQGLQAQQTGVNASHLELVTDSVLSQIVRQAIHQDEAIKANQYVTYSMQDKALASAQLPDPKLSLGLANMPLDSFDFNQEAMTQLKFSVSQMLPRGESLQLKQQTWLQKSQLNQFQLWQRAAEIEQTVSLLWLETYQAQQSIRLIEANRGLFEQLLEVSQASYSSALGRTRQGDIIKAELELIRLDDRLTELGLKKQANYARLGNWLNDLEAWPLETNLPQVQLKQADFYDALLATEKTSVTEKTLKQALLQHPSLLGLSEQVNIAQTATSLAQQAYRPQWGLSASYGYRDDADSGMSRTDFLSLAVTLDMPIFSQKAQDAKVKSAQSQSLSVEYKHALMLKKRLAKYRVIAAKVVKLAQRHQLYRSVLMPQLKQQEAVLLAAYNSNDGPFSDVIKARIENLNAELALLGIEVALQKQKVELNYLFARSDDFAFISSPSTSQY